MDSKSPSPNHFRNIKIKQEKIDDDENGVENHKNNKVEKLLAAVSTNLFDYDDTNKDDNIDNKNSVEPAKSSNEILAELFQVFTTSAPDIVADLNKPKKSHKKKHKKDKKHKKIKKKGRSSSDEDAVADEEDSSSKHPKIKLKKVKKEKKDKHKDKKHKQQRSSAELDLINEKDLKKEKSDKRKYPETDLPDDNISYKKKRTDPISSKKSDELDIAEYEKQLLEKQETDAIRSSGKIVIKSLKDSSVYKNAVKEGEAKNLEKEKRLNFRHESSKSSSISLSDEETYNRERSNRYNDKKYDYYGPSSSRDRYENENDRDYKRHDQGRYNNRHDSSNRHHRRYNDDDRRR